MLTSQYYLFIENTKIAVLKSISETFILYKKATQITPEAVMFSK